MGLISVLLLLSFFGIAVAMFYHAWVENEESSYETADYEEVLLVSNVSFRPPPCEAWPPFRAISSCFSSSIDAKPRSLVPF
jgi:hypothetical protein